MSLNKPKLRIIHHFACSGGTLISKCISALPNTFLLSELHPKTTKYIENGSAKFTPADIITQSRYAGVPKVQDLADSIFKHSINLTYEHVESYGGSLVIREHTHSDYCVGQTYEGKSYLVSLLDKEYDFIRLVTIRNPIDSYLSLVKNNWVQFTPVSFDEYCKRFWVFISQYEDGEIFKYEEFVSNPSLVLYDISLKLELDFDDAAIDIFSIFSVSGDSGRSGEQIEERARSELLPEFEIEIENSKYFKKIQRRFDYKF